MAEYIERETAVRAVMAAKWVDGSDGAMAMEIVASQAAADVAPVVHGRWICEWDTDLGITTVICSRCKDAREVRGCYVSTGGEGMYDEDAYCPNCGAKMDGERKDGKDG